MTAISDPQVRDFLSQGTRTGKLAFAASDGRPVINPVWFILEEDELVFNTGKNSAKGHAVQRDPRVALCVDSDEPPYAYFQVQGIATVSEDPAELRRTATAIAGRYMGAERAEEFGKRNGVPGELIVRIRPTKILGGLDMTG
jgi:PPOX class probable F420-dependent enzyme